MEKLVYIVWKRGGDSDAAFKQRLLGEVAPALLALPEAPALKLRISVVDDAVAAGAALRMDSIVPPKNGLVSFWLEQSQERAAAEQALAAACGRLAGYLVVESRPIVNTTQQAPPGERTPGFSAVSCIAPKPGLRYEEFVRIWYEVQRQTAIETQSTFAYTRNEVMRALTENAPRWAAIVEESFPEGALSDPHIFYNAPGDAAKLHANRQRMIETCAQFLDMQRVDSHPMSEYDF